ncbi:MAG: sigma-54 dependent transcriptional regulator [Bacteroidales bacterium]|jgi:DNA-binding NtrC family response regulator|nr:sigma-54 dependent transcriptional regulator [Bacteroidales bacterium]MDD3701982.1 sigma-54 dependent transcriptional regulator [Bacteroidales bacterium]MDY0368972.1 sigma-54 dependent transcriptional regulator [Bacteroidales bacterium]
MKNSNILIIDDNKSILSALELLLHPLCNEVLTSSNPNQIPFLLETKRFDAILLDMNYSAGITTGNEGLYWLKRILEYDTSSSVIMITAYGDVELAVRAIREGAVDFVLKPWDNSKLLATINAAVQLRNSRREVKTLKEREQNLKAAVKKERPIIIGQSQRFREVLDLVGKVAKTDANVLLTGENGTGKEVIAREIHLQSLRSNEVMVNVDIGSLSETLFESELFGHVKGAFTDAREDRAGKFELAKGSTLFLDEIANISLPLQAKLLVVLQNREVVRVGSNKKTPVDIRLICATNSNIQAMVNEGKFREDLLYRINTIQIEIPPLRERIEDIPLLAAFFLEIYTAKYKKQGLRFSHALLDKMTRYDWPGNVRELQHSIEKAVILSEGNTLAPDHFLFSGTRQKTTSRIQTLEEMEQQMIEASIRQNSGNMSAVASQLGITRQTLYNKIKKYGL